MSRQQKHKKIVLPVVIGVIAAVAIGVFFTSASAIFNADPSNANNAQGKIGEKEFEEQRDQALQEVRRFILESPTFAFDGLLDTLQIEYVSVMESFPIQYNIEARYTSAHAGYGNREGEMLAQVLTPHTVKLIVSEGKVISTINDRDYDEINSQFIQGESDLDDFPIQIATVHDYASLIDALEKKGITAEGVEILEDSSFSVPTLVISVNGENLQVYEFSSATEAQNAALLVSEDGTEIGTSIIRWIDTPHFYTQGNLIVLYVGHTQEMLNLLESLLDRQFAGM
ncbi:MAG: hypothetical protein ACT4N5_01535 [Nitrosopumilaceae archaeon]